MSSVASGACCVGQEVPGKSSSPPTLHTLIVQRWPSYSTHSSGIHRL